MIPLHKPAPGLTGALELKTLGRNPDRLEEGVRGVLDVSDYYYADLVSDATNASAGNVAPNNIGLEVDPLHMWLVRSAFAKFDFDVASNSADEQWVFTLEYRPVAGGTQFYLATETVLTSTLGLPLGAAATYSVILHRTFERPFLLKPGSFVTAGCSATLTAGGYLITLGVDVVAPPL